MDSKDAEAERSLLRKLGAPGEEAGRQGHGTDRSAGRTRGEEHGWKALHSHPQGATEEKGPGGEMGDTAGEGRAYQGLHRHLLVVQGCPHSPTLTVQTQG